GSVDSRAGRADLREAEELFARYGALVRRRARGILGDDAAADDVVQDVFVRVLGALRAFRRESQPSTWLYRITTNLCLNRIRDARRRRERLDREAEDVANTKPADSRDEESRITVEALLAAMPRDLAEVAVFYHLDGMDQDEIAAVTGIARRTVGYRLERFR